MGVQETVATAANYENLDYWRALEPITSQQDYLGARRQKKNLLLHGGIVTAYGDRTNPLHNALHAGKHAGVRFGIHIRYADGSRSGLYNVNFYTGTQESSLLNDALKRAFDTGVDGLVGGTYRREFVVHYLGISGLEAVFYSKQIVDFERAAKLNF